MKAENINTREQWVRGIEPLLYQGSEGSVVVPQAHDYCLPASALDNQTAQHKIVRISLPRVPGHS